VPKAYAKGPSVRDKRKSPLSWATLGMAEEAEEAGEVARLASSSSDEEEKKVVRKKKYMSRAHSE